MLTRRDQLKLRRERKDKDARCGKKRSGDEEATEATKKKKRNKKTNKKRNKTENKKAKKATSRKLNRLRILKSASSATGSMQEAAELTKEKVSKKRKSNSSPSPAAAKAKAKAKASPKARTSPKQTGANTRRNQRTKKGQRAPEAEGPFEEEKMPELLAWLQQFTDQPEIELKDLKKQVRSKLPKFTHVRLTIYWTRNACGIRLKARKKNCAYFSFKSPGEYGWGKLLMAIMTANLVAPCHNFFVACCPKSILARDRGCLRL